MWSIADPLDDSAASDIHFYQGGPFTLNSGGQLTGAWQPDGRLVSPLSSGSTIAEAPRGTLLHHYKVDRDGLVTWANLIIATGHNNAAMNRGVLQVARHFIRGQQIPEGMLNRVEAVIRAFDPCLSCSTHADGRLALEIELRNHSGHLLDARS